MKNKERKMFIMERNPIVTIGNGKWCNYENRIISRGSSNTVNNFISLVQKGIFIMD